ncbi:ABC transporter gloK [Metarhizium anisopliae]|nr:ABC transporter gloK [Metarhizium anisopliae]
MHSPQGPWEGIRVPSGDETPVRTKGIPIAGGQKQASGGLLAVLDDVDAATEDVVFHSLCEKQGLLRTSSTFVVVAPSDVRRGDSKTGTFKQSGSLEEIGEGVGLVSTDADWTGNNLSRD